MGNSNLDPVFTLDPLRDPHPDDIPSFKWPDLSPYAVEMRSWETKNRIPGWDPKNHQYPKMLYKSARKLDEAGNPKSKPLITDPYDENFSKRNMREVGSEAEERAARADGWGSIKEVLAEIKRQGDALATGAAHRLYEDRGMSDAARAEARESDEEAGIDHLPEIPEKRRPGRPRKQAAE